MDEDSLPDDWTCAEGVLVGMWPMNDKHGIGYFFGPESHTGLNNVRNGISSWTNFTGSDWLNPSNTSG